MSNRGDLVNDYYSYNSITEGRNNKTLQSIIYTAVSVTVI